MLSGAMFKSGRSSRYNLEDDHREYLNYGVDALIDQTRTNETIKDLFAQFFRTYIYVQEDPGWVPKKDIFSNIETLYFLSNQYGYSFTRSEIDDTAIPQLKSQIKAILKEFSQREIEGTNKVFMRTVNRLTDAKRITIANFGKTFQKDEYPVNKGYTVPVDIHTSWKALRKHLTKLSEAEAYSLYDPYISLFNQVYTFFEEYAKKNDVVFLSELNKRINEIVATKDVSIPELCCRVAPYVDHYLIDEFQDTNFLNWQNLLTLINEALSRGGSLFYVGDKKQAIYQFRGGDSRLFDLVPRLLPHYEATEVRLDVNYRSHTEIVNFINEVFDPQNLCDCIAAIERNAKDDSVAFEEADYLEITQNYDTAHQRARTDLPYGHVSIDTVGGDNSQECDEIIYERLIETIQDARTRDFTYSDIAILTRSNAELEALTTHLLSHDIPVISEKTLNIRRHSVVNSVIAFLRFLESPIDNTNFALFLQSELFLRAAELKADEIEEFLFKTRAQLREDKCLYYYMIFREKYSDLWVRFIEPFFKKVGVVPLYEFVRTMCEQFSVFELFADDRAFLMRFLELVKEEESKYASISSFLDFFDNLKDDDKKLYVPFAEVDDCLQLLTFHKAKGLEFPIVIIPFLSLSIKPAQQILTQSGSSDKEALALTHLLKAYAPWSQELGEQYLDELKKALVAELNIIYVALTRPQYELYCYVPLRIEGKKHNKAAWLFANCSVSRGTKRTGSDYSPKTKRKSEDVTYLEPSRYLSWVDSGHETFTEVSQIINRKRILRGSIMHALLSYVGNTLETSVDEYLECAEAPVRLMFPAIDDCGQYREEIRTLTAHKTLEWVFAVSDGVVHTEKELATRHGHMKRIDRLIVKDNELIVIDYKSLPFDSVGEEAFSDKSDPYKVQVREYMSILHDLYPKRTVRGYLLYMDTRVIEQVDNG